jgi:hypothetical protein
LEQDGVEWRGGVEGVFDESALHGVFAGRSYRAERERSTLNV